jgi:hypothetical protein
VDSRSPPCKQTIIHISAKSSNSLHLPVTSEIHLVCVFDCVPSAGGQKLKLEGFGSGIGQSYPRVRKRERSWRHIQ